MSWCMPIVWRVGCWQGMSWFCLLILFLWVSVPISVWGCCLGVRRLAVGGICISVSYCELLVCGECVVLVFVFGCCWWYLFLWCVGWFRQWLWWDSIACCLSVGGVRDSWCGVCSGGVFYACRCMGVIVVKHGVAPVLRIVLDAEVNGGIMRVGASGNQSLKMIS